MPYFRNILSILLETKAGQWRPIHFPYGVIIKVEKPTTIQNIKRLVRITEAKDEEVWKKLYVEMLHSQEFPFILYAYDALKALNYSDPPVFEKVWVEFLSKDFNAEEAPPVIRALAELKSPRTVDLFMAMVRNCRSDDSRQAAMRLKERQTAMSEHGYKVACGRIEAAMDRLLESHLTDRDNAKLAATCRSIGYRCFASCMKRQWRPRTIEPSARGVRR